MNTRTRKDGRAGACRRSLGALFYVFDVTAVARQKKPRDTSGGSGEGSCIEEHVPVMGAPTHVDIVIELHPTSSSAVVDAASHNLQRRRRQRRRMHR